MSDSDSSRDGRSSRHRIGGRSRSSSGSSSDSRYSYKRKSFKHKRSKGHRSRSRDRRGKSRSYHNLRSRSSSKSHSRRSSRDRSRSRRRSRSRSRSRRSSRSQSRRRSRSRSRYRSHSRDRNKHKSSSPEILKQEPSTEEQLHAKLQRAIRAAQSADDQLRQQGLLSGTVSRKDPIIYQLNVIDEINDSSFVPKHFTSSKQTQELPVIDLTVDAPVMQSVREDPESIFHTSLKVDPQTKLDKWVKKLFHLRQKAINGEPLA